MINKQKILLHLANIESIIFDDVIGVRKGVILSLLKELNKIKEEVNRE